jgi:hypothetical protein
VNKSVPTLLGIVIILLVVLLIVLMYNLRMTQAIGRGERVVGTVGGELITGEQAPDEFIEETSALRDEPDRPEPTTIRPEARTSERRQAAEGRRGQRRAAGETPESPGSR